MRVQSAAIVLASGLLASCAIDPALPSKGQLVGRWQQRIEVLGEKKYSEWQISADGGFVLTGRSEARGIKADYEPERGRWHLDGKVLALRYQASTQPQRTGWVKVADGKLEIRDTNPEAEQPLAERVEYQNIVKLTRDELVIADVKHGIEQRYVRSSD